MTTPTWNQGAVAHLLDARVCPVCDIGVLDAGRCRACGADLATAEGDALWAASVAAADALRAREAVRARVPRRPHSPGTSAGAGPGTGHDAVPVAGPDAVPVAGPDARAHPSPPPAAPHSSPPRPSPPRPSPRRPAHSATVQSVLAIAGAGLLAIAAVVFTFLNPDVTDATLRGLVVAGVTAVFLAGAWMLARRGLRFSAEAVGALGVVFLALDVRTVAETIAGVTVWSSGWLAAGLATLAAAVVLLVLALRTRIRAWLWSSAVALTLVPAMCVADGGAVLRTAGWLGAMLAGALVLGMLHRLTGRMRAPLRADRVTVTVLQLIAVLGVLLHLPALLVDSVLFDSVLFSPVRGPVSWLLVSGALALLAALAVFTAPWIARGLWSVVAGIAGVGAAALAPFSLGLTDAAAYLVLIPAATALALVVLALVALGARPLARVDAAFFRAGLLVAVGAVAIAPVVGSLGLGLRTALGHVLGQVPWPFVRDSGAGIDPATAAALAGGVAALAAGLGAFAVVTRDRRRAPWSLSRASARIALWLGMLAVLTFACNPALTGAGTVAVSLAAGILLSVAIAAPRLRELPLGVRLPVVVGAHLAVLLAALVSWTWAGLAVAAGFGVLAGVAALALPVPQRARSVYVGSGFAYALVVLGTAAADAGLGAIPLVCLLTVVASVAAMTATLVRRLSERSWYAVLAVTAVPFLLGIAQVLIERSGWTAMSTALIFFLALTLVVTRRPGQHTVLRIAAAFLLIPTLAVIVVCLGAQLLEGSGSPVVLPVVAALVAITLTLLDDIRRSLQGRVTATDLAAVMIAIESSALLTAAIAVALAIVRDAAGLPTTALVLTLLAAGGAGAALHSHRRYGWWLASASATGALACGWLILGVTVIEPYVLPPALALAIVGIVLATREGGGLRRYGVGLSLVIVPALVAQITSETGWPSWWRCAGLLVGAAVLLMLARAMTPPTHRSPGLARLALPTRAAAIVAAAAGVIEGARLGLGLDARMPGIPVVLVCLALGLASAAIAAVAGTGIRRDARTDGRLARSRWLLAPAALSLGAATWPAIARDAFTVGTLWVLMIAFLVLMLVAARRACAGSTTLPPVWFLFALAFVTAVVAWSPRDLRVEAFSIPLGAFLLAAGAAAWAPGHRASDPAVGSATPVRAGLSSWPAGFGVSWMLLAPGLIVLMSASIVATFTDPLTWRAVLVIVIALVAILVGAVFRLAAPFLIGVVVLPVENAFVFAVQIGRGIASMPWWITLSVVGAVLLILAVTYERRDGADASLAARLRDLA